MTPSQKNHKCTSRIPENHSTLGICIQPDGCHKARLVAGGYLTPDPIDSIYSGVVSTRSLRLSIFLAKLNNMKVWAADIGHEYLEATTKQKLYIVAGPEFEELQGHTSDSQSTIWIENLRIKMVTKNP